MDISASSGHLLRCNPCLVQLSKEMSYQELLDASMPSTIIVDPVSTEYPQGQPTGTSPKKTQKEVQPHHQEDVKKIKDSK